MSAPLTIDRIEWVADTGCWRVGVALAGGVWIPGAFGKLPDGGTFWQVLAVPGHSLGVDDLAEAVRIASVYAQDPEQGFGRVRVWHVEPWQRGDPRDHRCAECGELYCDGDHDDYYAIDMDDDDTEGPCTPNP